MAPKYKVGKRVVGVRGTNSGLHGVISNRVQVSGSWWLEVTCNISEVRRTRTGDGDLEGVGAAINASVPPVPVFVGNAVEEGDRDGSDDESSQGLDSSEGSGREDLGDADGNTNNDVMDGDSNEKNGWEQYVYEIQAPKVPLVVVDQSLTPHGQLYEDLGEVHIDPSASGRYLRRFMLN